MRACRASTEPPSPTACTFSRCLSAKPHICSYFNLALSSASSQPHPSSPSKLPCVFSVLLPTPSGVQHLYLSGFKCGTPSHFLAHLLFAGGRCNDFGLTALIHLYSLLAFARAFSCALLTDSANLESEPATLPT